jgi:hypothetical protein
MGTDGHGAAGDGQSPGGTGQDPERKASTKDLKKPAPSAINRRAPAIAGHLEPLKAPIRDLIKA